jgi:ferredoxin-nitrate reductase
MAADRDSIKDIWGARTPFAPGEDWAERVDEHLVDTPDRWVKSACVLCSTGCALEIGVKGGRMVGVRGTPHDRVNHGRLGPKGLHGWMANQSADRLTRPLLRKGGALEPVSWAEAMAVIAEHSKAILNKLGPGAIGFYTSGQLMLEEYYTQAIVARAGIGTNHLDGNTRLCTSTAAMSLIESFGTDGAPGSFTDFDHTAAVLLVGHNLAETQTVLWMRLLDRRRGANPPRLVVIDPRKTPTAAEADLHLRPRVGTNVALLNGLLHLIIESGHIDAAFIAEHTVGFVALCEVVSRYPAHRVEELTGVPASQLREAAQILGAAPSLVSSCLQGVYQSWQATAAAVQVNNLQLVRGMIGKPGSTVFQMNGQPSAQNARECGADGELPVFFNWANEEHVAALARHWNVPPSRIPHHAPPTDIMSMLRYVEEGSLRLLWVTATNPAVSLPDLPRVRKAFSKDSLFLVVNDCFLTETAKLADVVLPAAIWAEKTGTFTNADRTVHLSNRAIDPPGEAKSDLDIFLDYARRMDFRDQSGAPLVKWRTAEEAFEHFKALSQGRPCDYSGLSYALLQEGGIQWPCNAEHPRGTPRLYGNGVFPTHAARCETYGHDLVTGAMIEPAQYQAADPNGKAQLKAAEYEPLPEAPDARYPLMLTTGRTVWHWHTRTKTARSPLQEAAPEAWVELSIADARRAGVDSGDWVELESRRGKVEARVKVTGILPGHAFMPFHYGSFDAEPGTPSHAANELTRMGWDPVSKQPHFKFAAVHLRRLRGGAGR